MWYSVPSGSQHLWYVNGTNYVTLNSSGVLVATTLNLTNALAVAYGGTGLTSTSQNFVFAGPTSGAGAPTFRALVSGDIPTNAANTTGSAGSLSTTLTSTYVLYGQGTGVPAFNSGFTFTAGTGVNITGYMQATGDVVAYFSDTRLKNVVGKIEDPLEKLKNLSGFLYYPNEIAKSHGFDCETRRVGVSAQEVQKILPEAVSLAPFDSEGGVSKSGENYLTVHYDRLVPLLIECIKELQQRVQVLERKNI
jgi:hypothetical protein